MNMEEAVTRMTNTETILDSILLLLAVFALLAAIAAGVKGFRYLFPDKENTRHWREDTDSKLRKDYIRLNDMDARIHAMETGQEEILLSIKALLHHQVTGNSIDKLKLRESELDTYLIKQRGDPQ